jgi:WD40 repeat protein/outer membrane protein OmpA-like peptidoglycan-associated protein
VVKPFLNTYRRKTVLFAARTASYIAVCLLLVFSIPLAEISAQSLTMYDVNASAFPLVRAKFFALDADGKPIPDLSVRDFAIRENGTPRSVTTATCPPQGVTKSLSVVLTIDVSGSMSEGANGISNLTLAQTAARAWVQAMPENNVECALTSYDHNNYLNQDFTQDRKRLLKAISSLKPLGGTDYDMGLLRPVAGGLYVAQNAKNSRRIIIFLTDGQGGGNEEQIIEVAKNDGVTIYCVTLGMPAPDILRNIARKTGGECFENVTSIQQAEQIYRILLQLALGNRPCEIAWMSEKTCNVSRMNTTFTLPSRMLSQSLSYDIPAKSITALEFSSENLGFGGVPYGTSRELKLVIRARNAFFTINNIESSDDRFSISPSYFQLKPGQRKVLSVKFTPTDSGYAYTKFTLNENICGGRTLYASGGFPGKKPHQTSLRILEPNGGESYVAGSDTTLLWTGIMPSEAVSVDFSATRGASWQPVIAATSGLRSDWRIPAQPTNQALVRLRQLPAPKLSSFKDYMSSVTFLPDSKTAITLGAGGMARAWDIRSGSMGQIYFSNQFGQRKNAALPGKIIASPNGKYVVAGFNEGTVRIWDAQSGDLNEVYYDHFDGITAIQFAPEGTGASRVLTASLDSTAKIWYTENAETIQTFKHNGPIYDAAFSPDGSLVATASADSTAIIWDAKTGDLLYKLTAHTDVVFSVTFSPDGTKLLTTSADATARLWDVRKGTPLERLTGHRSIVISGAFSPDGNRVVTSSADSTIKIWNGKNGGWVQNLRGHLGVIRKIVFTPDGSALASVSADRTARIWDVETGRTVQILGGAGSSTEAWLRAHADQNTSGTGGHAGEVYDIAFSRDGQYAATVGTDRKAFFWRVNTTASVSAGSTFQSRPLSWLPDTNATQEAVSSAPFAITAPRFSARDVYMGRQLRGEAKDSVLTSFLQNNDTSPLRVDNITFFGEHASDFSIVSGGAPLIIPPKSTRSLELRFRPVGVGDRTATMRIVSQADTLLYTVTGAGSSPLIVVTNRTVDFEEVKIKQQRDTLVAILKNISLQPVIITGITFTGPNTTDFRLVGNASQSVRTDTSYILYPQATMSLRLRYKPTSAGRTSCQLQIAYNSLGSPASVQLFGTGGSTISAYIQAFGLKPNANTARKDSVEYPIQSLRVEEFLANTMHPLLNYIFFENGSFTIPTRYNRLSPEQARRIIEMKQPFETILSAESTLEVYRNVLNIIGSRMTLNPASKITLIGCKSAKEKFAVAPPAPKPKPSLTTNATVQIATQATVSTTQTVPTITQRLTAQDDARLSEARALAIKDYLRTAWGIAEERITTQFRILPEKFSNEQTPDGVAENRRVEIIASTPDITDVVVVSDTLRTVVPPVVRFRTNATSQVNLTSWNVNIAQSTGAKAKRVTQALKNMNGSGKPQDRIEWNTTQENNTAPKLTIPVQYTLSVNDESGANTSASGVLPVEVISIAKKRAAKTVDKEVNTFGLLLFDFNKAEISGQNTSILDYVRQRMRPESRISITGYTDRTGNALTNKTLSLQRATAAAAILNRPDATTQGRGHEGLLHDNTTPEGRFYCRTVNIVVENAVR